MKMQKFQVFEEVIMKKDSCSFCVYGLSLDSHKTDPGLSRPNQNSAFPSIISAGNKPL